MKGTSAIVRRVDKSDREDVFEISSKIWGGHDYIPSVFDEWLKDSKSHTYGVEADGRIIAIGNMRLVDRGKTGWMEGLRVHPKYRKQGFADMLTQYLVELGKELGVERLRYSTGGNNRASLKLARRAGFKRLFKMNTLWYENVDTEVSVHKRMNQATPIELFKLLKTNPLLIPKDILVFDWKAIDASLQGFKEAGKDHKFCFTRSREKMTGFSFGHEHSGSDGGSWSFTTYATEPDVFVPHFDYQINQSVKLGLRVAACTCPTQFESILKEHSPKFRWRLQLILLEKEMNP